MKYLLHYGLQRSGTNYMETLIGKNFQIKILNSDLNRDHPIQKHFRLYDDKTLIPHRDYDNNLTFRSFPEYEQSLRLTKIIDGILIVSKDPYSWYISYSRWAKKCNWPSVNYHYIEEYNKFYGKWMEFSKNEPRILFIKYIDLLTHTERELNKIKDRFDLSNRLFRKLFLQKTKITKVSQSYVFTKKRLKFYTEKEYLDQLGLSELDKINATIDIQLMKDLNYALEKGV